MNVGIIHDRQTAEKFGGDECMHEKKFLTVVQALR